MNIICPVALSGRALIERVKSCRPIACTTVRPLVMQAAQIWEPNTSLLGEWFKKRFRWEMFCFLYSYLEKKRSTTSDVGSKVQSTARSRGAMDFAQMSFFGDRKEASSYCRLVSWIERNENRKTFFLH